MRLALCDFQDTKFLDIYKAQIDSYVFLKVAGRSSRAALRVAFGDDYANSMDAQSYIDHIECNAYYLRAFNQVLAKVPIDQLWNKKIALHRLLSLTEDSSVKDNVRAAAIRELNLLLGFSEMAGDGSIKPRHTLDDFYATVRASAARSENGADESAQTGPNKLVPMARH